MVSATEAQVISYIREEKMSTKILKFVGFHSLTIYSGYFPQKKPKNFAFLQKKKNTRFCIGKKGTKTCIQMIIQEEFRRTFFLSAYKILTKK